MNVVYFGKGRVAIARRAVKAKIDFSRKILLRLRPIFREYFHLQSHMNREMALRITRSALSVPRTDRTMCFGIFFKMMTSWASFSENFC